MIKFSIPAIPPSLNRFAGRNNTWEYRNVKNRWTAFVKLYAPKVKEPIEPAKVRITYHFPTKARHDEDNYLKFILDGLTAAGLIVDDSLGHITVEVVGKWDKLNPRTEVEICEQEA